MLLLAVAGGLHAQKSIYWGTAHDYDLRGSVRFVRETCTDGNGAHPTNHEFEFTRGGELQMFASPHFIIPDCIIRVPESRKVTKRNSHGDVEEAAFSLEGDVVRKIRAELVYDNVGNWTRRVNSQLFTYTWEGGPPENSWHVSDICTRDIEYYR
jgi:hypothetical protein